MEWTALETENQLDQLCDESKLGPVLIFKYSSRCSISSVVLNRLERNWKPDDMANVKAYFLDLIAHRAISNLVSNRFGVVHESPQAILVEHGQCTFHQSHYGINYDKIADTANRSQKAV